MDQLEQIVDFVNQARGSVGASAPSIVPGSTMADFGEGHVFNMADLWSCEQHRLLSGPRLPLPPNQQTTRRG